MTAVTFPLRKSAAASPWRLALTVLRSLHKVRQERLVAAELAKLDDRLLADLGLARGDIQAVSRGELRR